MTVEETVDRYVPQSGNRGYRVSRYELDVHYKVASNRLAGRTTIHAVTTRARPRYSLDLSPALSVSKVLVNGGKPAKYTHQHGKLTVTPAQPIPAGGMLTLVITYAGAPKPVRGPWGAVGWEELTDGALVAGQPNGAASWFPCDDHPSSKASYRISISTDSPYYALANGALVAKQVKAGRTTWVYEQSEPMATYLATVQIGGYVRRRVLDGHGHPGPVPINAVLPTRLNTRFDHDFGRQPEMMALFERLFGPYPFAEYTVVVTDDDLEIPLEAQGLSIFGANHCDGRRGAERLVAHELAHQWFGNSLTIRRWRDIWLNEGFARYAEWLWSESIGGSSATHLAKAARQKLARLPQDIIIGDPGPDLMFDDRLYRRGALTLHSLRHTLGDGPFFGLLQDWVASHWHASVSTGEFVDMADRYTSTPLDGFWNAWLWSGTLPELPA